MKCHVCGATFKSITTDLPFKRGEHSIVIVKNLPVLQCENCREYLIEDSVMKWVEKILEGISPEAELEIVRYAA